MPRLLIVFGTTHGHTRKIAGALAEHGRELGCSVDVIEAAGAMHGVRPEGFDAVIVAASMHIGGFQKPVLRWLRHNARELDRRPTAFLAVCLAVLQQDPAVRAELERHRDRFLARAGWHPTETRFVAGAIPYTRYSWLMKLVMRRKAAQAGGGTDTSRDYEYTDWHALRTFLDDLVSRVSHGAASGSLAAR